MTIRKFASLETASISGNGGANNQVWSIQNNVPDWFDAPPSMPVGAVIHVAGNTAPTGFLKCNGAAISRSSYSNLFSMIGTIYGSGDGSTTFNLPDLRGEFVRGWDDGRGIDSGRALGSAQGDANKSHTHTGSAASAGDHSHSGTTGTESSDHTHNMTQYAGAATQIGGSYGMLDFNAGYGYKTWSTGGRSAAHTHSFTTASGGAHTHILTINADGGTEARPRNVALLACIKY